MKAPSRLVDALSHLDVGSEPLLLDFVERFDDASDQRYRLHHGEAGLARQLVQTLEFYRNRTLSEASVRVTAAREIDGKTAAAGDPEGSANSLLEVAVEEQSFVVDTIQLFLDFVGLQVVSSCYVVLPGVRDEGGTLTGFAEGEETAHREILARFELLGDLEPSFQQTLVEAIQGRLETAKIVVSDFRAMRTRMGELSHEIGEYSRGLTREPASARVSRAAVLDNTRSLVEWLTGDNFVFMGLSFRPSKNAADSREEWTLGQPLHNDEDRAMSKYRSQLLAQADRPLDEWVVAYKSQEESQVHRAGKIDNFLIRSVDPAGETQGFYHLRGLFTFRAIQTPGGQIPLVRLKLDELLAEARFKRGSIPWKGYTNAFNSIPVEYLFEAPPMDIAVVVDKILYVEKEKELRTHMTIDRERRKGLFFLALPRQGYSEDLRSRIEANLIEGLGATYSDSRVYFGKFDTVLLTFFFTAAEYFREFSADELDERVRRVAGTWEDRSFQILVQEVGLEKANGVRSSFRHAFPDEYQLTTPPEEAVLDVIQLHALRQDTSRDVGFEVLYGDKDREQGTCRLRLYLERNVYLSTLLPILDNFGVQVVDQAAYRLPLQRGHEVFVQTLRVAGIKSADHPLIARKEIVLEALDMAFRKQVDSDILNRLVVDLGLSWQDVNLFRAYVNYLRQLGVVSTFAFMSNTFRQFPDLTRLLVHYYEVRFDPARGGSNEERLERSAAVEEEIFSELGKVPSQAQDNFIRLVLNCFSATLRTSRYQSATEEQAQRLSFKIDSSKLIVGSDPKPWREIFVHHYLTEGIHLRGGRLARGGIRWSDRVTDYREEVLGLMRTQMVKNVLIVPVGAKGGFVVRRPAADLDRRRAQGDEMYQIYINGLLDLTDNVVHGEIVQPTDVVCFDEEDPYFVVAADKGTAHLSDTANAISESRGFWLGDAFASGGSNGYDHKALGITARGAWESVRRHFRELGLDVEVDTVTVTGVGDMAGDVFGNGLLCSRTLQLQAAFNHMHIFLDPDPDPAASFVERKRLFDLPRSTWADYRADLISDGGGVYDRNAKFIQLQPAALRMLSLEGREQRPDDVIRAILSMKADLFWNGGIGTYIRSSREDNRDVGDLSNESVRISARQFRARVMGEGGNLGVTQAGRIELAQRGCRLNTDFVDNSAGVNCSDHEVNIKILLEQQIKSGALAVEERNSFLASLSDQVCRDVLQYNYDQTLSLSLDQERSRRDLYSFERTVKTLEDRGLVDRARDHLPPLENLGSRHSKNLGLTRPELATLSAYTKMEVYQRLLESPEGSIPDLEDYLVNYFPDAVVDRFGDQLGDHLLANELGMTVLTNLIVDHAGATFFFDAARETGCTLAELVRAYLLVDELFQGWGMKNEVLSLDGRAGAEQQYEALLTIEESIRRSVVWVVGGHQAGRLDRLEREHARYQECLKAYEAQLPAGLAKPERKRFRASEDVYYEAGFKIGLPGRLARFTYLPAGLRIVDVSLASGVPVDLVTRLYFRIGQESQIFPLVRISDDKDLGGRWESLALRVIRNSLLDSLWSMTSQVVQRGGIDDEAAVERAVGELRQEPQFEELRLDLRNLISEELTVASLQVMSWRLAQSYGG